MSHETEIPFSTRSSLHFYTSLMGRYSGRLAGMAVFMLVFAVFSFVRLGAVGLVLDAVDIHVRADPGGGTDPDDESASDLIHDSRRNSVDRFEAIWTALLPSEYPPPTEGLADPARFWSFIRALALTLAVMSLGIAAAFFVKEAIGIGVVTRMLVDVRRTLFGHLTRQPVAFFHDRRAGDLISRVTNDVESTQSSLHHIFDNILHQPVMILVGLVMAVVASPFLFLCSIPVIAAMIVPVVLSGRRVIRHGRRRQHRLGIITEALQQLFGGIRIVKAFGMERCEREAFDRKNEAFGRSFRKTLQAKVTGRSLQEALYNLGLAGLLLGGAWLLADTESGLSPGDFSVFILAMVQVYTPVKMVSKAWNKVQEARAGVERVLDILRREPSQRDRPGAREFPGLRELIRFENVSFSYRDLPEAEEPIVPPPARIAAVDGIELTVARGESLALVGPSGSGKSTVVDLLARFYEPQEGAILIDGVDVREYRLASYLESIAIVSQDPFLFNTTIRDNIAYGREGATEDEVVAAAKAANAHAFILSQPDGYDTVIGERGAKLSGGQRQRLTIARALLKNAPILILDEATSALDTEAEREVQSAIDNLMRERTTFVIAHRLSTITGADRIAVLEGGRVVETGTHDELMSSRGRYFALYTSQEPRGAGRSADA